MAGYRCEVRREYGGLGRLEAAGGLWQSRAMLMPFVLFAFGLVFGSFLNVCIWRLARHESLVTPGSHCPKCGAAIRPADNIPLVSYALLRGRCRHCHERISAVYPIVELATGAIFAGCFAAFGPTLAALKWILFCSILLVLIFTDLHERILPDTVTYSGLAAGLALSVMTPPVDGSAWWLLNGWLGLATPDRLLRLADAALGALVGGGLLWLFAEGYFRLRGREGMGLGDVKMMAMAGAFLGARHAILMMLLGSILGSVVGAIVVWGMHKGKDYELPFGTFLGIAGLALVFLAGLVNYHGLMIFVPR